MQPEEIAKYLKEKKKVLIMSGWLCDRVELDGKKLIEYVVELANKLDAPVAATGNTVNTVRERINTKTKKMWAAEIPMYLRYDWNEPFERPDVIVLIGYTPDVVRSIVTAMDGEVETVVLESKEVKEATISLPNMTVKEWKRSLEKLINSI